MATKQHKDHETHGLQDQVKHFGKKHPFEFLSTLEALFEEYLLEKAPFQLPDGAREFIVKVVPYLTVLFLILGLPIVLALFGLGGYMHMMGSRSYYGGGTGMFYLFGIISLLVFVLEALAIPGLFAKTKQGRNLLYYAQLVSIVSSLLVGNIVGGLLSLLIGMYLLFQVKSYYH